MSKTEFGQDLSSAAANSVYLLKTEDDTIIGILSLENGVDINKHVSDLQEYLYTITDLIGLVGEADPNAKVYTTNNVIANGDNYKVCIEKYDVQMQLNIDNIATNATNIATNVVDIAAIIASIGAANGIAPLDGDSKVPLANMPNGVFAYKGTWNATTNTPTLVDGTGNSGEVYRTDVAGTQDLGSGSQTFAVGDKVVYNGTIWEKWDTTDEVTSVFGRTGDVVAQTGDYTATQIGLGNVTDDAQLKRSAGDLNTFTEKVTPLAADIILIEDSADSLNKKKIQVGSLISGASPTFTTVTKTAAATLATAGEDNVVVDATTADFTITLPSAVGNNGLTYNIVKSTAANKVTIAAAGAEEIGGYTSLVMASENDSLKIYSDSVGWQIAQDGIVYAARYTSNSGQTIPSSSGVLIYEDLDFDDAGIYNPITGIGTIPLGGLYTLRAMYDNASSTAGLFYRVTIKVNTVVVAFDSVEAKDGSATGVSIGDTLRLNKDDTFQIDFFSDDSLRSLATDSTRNIFSIARIGG